MVKSFPNSLPSFDAEDEMPISQEEEREVIEVSSPSITLHPDEVEALKAEAYERGLADGALQAKETLSDEMQHSLEEVISFFEEMVERQKEVLQSLHGMMVEGVFSVVKLFLGPNLAQTELKRHLTDDVSDMVKLFDKKLILKCSKEDEKSLKTLLTNRDNISIIVEESKEQGQLSLLTESSQAVLDQAVWMQGVRERIIQAAKAVMQLRRKDS